MTLDDEDRIDLDVRRALDGAQGVRARLEAYLSLGVPSIRDTAYAIKSRVKQPSSAKKKILDHQKKDPSYSARNLRDIVGFRFITLYESFKSTLLRELLRMIEAHAGCNVGLFINNPSGMTTTPIEEIKIFVVKGSDSEAQLGIILDQLKREGYHRDAGSLAPVEVETKDSKYSSIHIVVWCNGQGTDKANKPVPVEIQIRSAFEDVWGEIDHSLKYKDEDDAHPDYDSMKLSVLQRARSDIKNLKNIMQAASERADSIRDLLRILDEEKGIVSAPLSSLSSFEAYLDQNRLLPRGVREAMSAMLRKQNDALGMEERKALSLEDRRPFYDAIKDVLSGWAVLDEEWSDKPNPAVSPDCRRDIGWHIRMEQAMCQLAAGQGAARFAASGAGNFYQEARDHIAEALRAYRKLAEEYPGRAIVSYRMALALDELGESDLAIDQLEKAVVFLEADNIIPGNSWLKIVAPRTLGYLLWDKADMHRERGKGLGLPPDFMKAERLELLRKAYVYTSAVIGRDVESYDGPDGHRNTEIENCLSINNAASYALEITKLDAKLDDIGVTPDLIKHWTSVLSTCGLWMQARVDILDTLRQLLCFIGDEPGAIKIADKVIAEYSQPEAVRFAHERRYVELLEAAKATRDSGCPPDH